MSIFLERFILPLLVAVVMGVCVFNPWKWDLHQRISLSVAAIALAYFVGYTLTSGKPAVSPITGSTPIAQPSVNTTNGPQSPIMPDNSGNVTITNDNSNPKEPPPKDKSK
jgi:hypothetical protein